MKNSGIYYEKILSRLYRIRVRIYCVFSTCVFYVKCKIWKVAIGKNCKAIGRVIICKTPSSIIKIGEDCTFNSSSLYNYRGINHCCILQTGSKSAHLEIGNNCGFSGVSIVSNVSVKIGNNCHIGANCTIGDRDDHRDVYNTADMPIVIGDNTWLGMNVVVLKGVTIGRNVVVGANSLVTKDIPSDCVAAGSPAKVIRKK